MCGEKFRLISCGLLSIGSPPRVRGKVAQAAFQPVQLGITPAYAGKRPLRCHLRSAVRDHPRVCGEKLSNASIRLFCAGSPPRMRGKAIIKRSNDAGSGITPAYAGKRQIEHFCPSFDGDHPRVCGEKTQNPIGGQFQQGSPPRMRGKETINVQDGVDYGITPAYAGKRGEPRRCLQGKRDHPRVCGEKMQSRKAGTFQLGSPPRMRGKVYGRS